MLEAVLRKILQTFFGSGADISETNPLPVTTEYAFPGTPYSNTDTAVNDDARRFEAAELKLRDVVIKVTDNNQLLGDVTAQNFELAAGGSIGISFLDLSLFYFRNATPGSDGTVSVFGTRC